LVFQKGMMIGALLGPPLFDSTFIRVVD